MTETGEGNGRDWGRKWQRLGKEMAETGEETGKFWGGKRKTLGEELTLPKELIETGE